MNKLFVLLFIVFVSADLMAELPNPYYRVGSGSEADFFAYHRPSDTLTLYEVGSFSGPNGKRTHSYTNYFIDLKEKKVLRSLRGKERLKGCFGGRVMRHPGGKVVASQNNNSNTLSILDLETGECRQKHHDLTVLKFSWSNDGEWLELMDRGSGAFYRMDPKTMQLEKLEQKGAMDSLSWSSALNRTIYIYRTQPVNDVYESSEDYGYYYVDDEGVQRKMLDKHPMVNPEGDVYFYTEFEDEQSPATTFVDVKSGKVMVKQPEFYLAFSNRYATWLKDNWVYFEGATGVLNYRTGEFVSFGTEKTPHVSPFSISEGRYAMMYLMGEDRLMVYDLEKREYIETYEPFWRE